tara:strand:+ start:156 stop:404 length:249 start_codon:yes stop_codon:yes gene_type:complete
MTVTETHAAKAMRYFIWADNNIGHYELLYWAYSDWDDKSQAYKEEKAGRLASGGLAYLFVGLDGPGQDRLATNIMVHYEGLV